MYRYLITVVFGSIFLLMILPENSTAQRKMYWGDDSGIHRANLDLTEIEDLIINPSANLGDVKDLSLDLVNGKMYWTHSTSWGSITRANLDGTSIENLVPHNNPDSPEGITLDIENGKMYWTDPPIGLIRRANLDGTSIEDLVTMEVANWPLGITLDKTNNKMYWVEEFTNDGNSGFIRRANLDGTAIEDLVTQGLAFPRSIALDLIAGKMYWGDGGNGGVVNRANLDGTDVENVIPFQSQLSVDSIALDIAMGKVYWTQWPINKGIRRGNLDGTGIEILDNNFHEPTGLTLDLRPVEIPTQQEEAIVIVNDVFVAPGENAAKMPITLSFIDTTGEPITTDGPAVGGLEFNIDLSDLDYIQVTDLILDADLSGAGFELKKTIENNGFGYKVVIFNLQGDPISPSNGQAVAWLCFTVNSLPNTKMLQGELPDPIDPLGSEGAVTISNVAVSDDFGNEIGHSSKDGLIQIGIRCDVNKNGIINVADVVTIVGRLVGKFLPLPDPNSDPNGYTEFASGVDHKILDGNNDGMINIVDAIAIVNKILNLPLDDGVTMSNKSVVKTPIMVDLGAVTTQDNDGLTIPILLQDNSIAGAQLSLSFDPTSLSVGLPQLVGNTTDMILESHSKDGTLHIVLVNLRANKSMINTDLPMLSIPVTLLENKSEATLKLTEALLAGRNTQILPVQIGNGIQIITRKMASPPVFSLKNNVPNPFNPSTTIFYEVSEQAHINLTIYNLIGQKVVQLIDKVQSPGRYAATWHGRNATGQSVASSVYLYRLVSSNGFVDTRRMTLLK